MAKKDKTDRKSFEDMRAEREAEVKSSLEAASDRMADAQGESMLANINRRTDEAKGEEERKRNYHLLQASAIRENEKRRMENTAVNVGEPPQSVERADISGNALAIVALCAKCFCNCTNEKLCLIRKIFKIFCQSIKFFQ